MRLSGALDNHDEGALVSQGKQTVSAANLNNRGGIVSGQQAIELTIAQQLDNSEAGLISAEGQLTLAGEQAELLNRGGQISAKRVALKGRSLDNSGGLLVSEGVLTGTLTGALINANRGRLASGAELLLSAGSLDNRGGQLASQSRLQITTGQLNNSAGGTLASQDELALLLADGDLDNSTDGLLHSAASNLLVQAKNLNNQGGKLNGQGDVSLQLSGALDNSQQGRIESSAGQLLLTSSSLDNSAGGILSSASGLLQLLTGHFNNNAGITQASRLVIDAQNGIDNRSGHLSAVQGDNRITTTVLDNQGGGLYAGNLLHLSANELLNQSGKVGAGTIDFSLAGALNNSSGLIESTSNLSIAAATIDNQSGRLRALGQSGITSLSSGWLDNRDGRLETANTDLNLNLVGIDNAGGTFLHVGTGQFGISAGQILQAGGSFVTTGRLDITADAWSNSSVLQAGWLNLNVGNFTQTASGQLLASQALTGRGGNWNNDGLIASDGSLDIQLTGTYNGNGRVTSLGDLTLSANQLDLTQNASVAGGQTVTLGASILRNHGRITSAGSLIARAGQLDNFGTLGSAETVRVEATNLLNENGLIFSGGNLLLRTQNFTNRYADVYSLGDLDLAADDGGTWANTLHNLSATLESVGDMRLRVRTLENRMESYSVAAGDLISASIGVRCYECNEPPAIGEGRVPASHLVWMLNYSTSLEESSAPGSIVAGRDLDIQGDSLLNKASTISAGNNIAMALNTFTNQGIALGDYSLLRSFEVPYRGSEGVSFWEQVMAYNAANDPEYQHGTNMSDGSWRPVIRFWNADWDESLEDVMIREGGREADRFAQFGSIRYGFFGASPFDDFARPNYQPGGLVEAPDLLKNATAFDEIAFYGGDSSFISAVVQAGGNVIINAAKDLSNSVIREGVEQAGSNSRVDETGVSGNAPTVVTLNPQLPPEQAQQQVNPITLPGFSLPTGSNGLFRLSGQDATQGSTQTVGSGGSFSFAGQTIGLGEREHALNGSAAQVGNVLVGNGSSASGSTATASLNVAQVQGVPSTARPDNSHKYLIETNPDLTSLKSFLSSDYLLGLLGYDPDHAQMRLGDGLYEQRLIQQAIVARTGQRYIAGINNDEALFKYLMDNAIPYKDRLNLQVGVGLTAEQVAALTHDIVWLEEAIVNGEKVLVPVLYMAQATGRLGPNGALIMGNDVSLISGGNLSNQGTLRASGDLAASAVNITNSGLVEANRLDLIAIDSIKNTQGGILSGRDVSLAALTGDVINERSVTVHEGNLGNRTWTQSYTDSAARIEASNSISINAGRDVSNIGGAIQAGGSTVISAGRDVNLVSAQTLDERTNGRHSFNQNISQLGGEVTAGRDLAVSAGRDITLVATDASAGRDVSLSADRNVTIASGADEQHSYFESKKVTKQEDHVQQQSSSVTAGGDVTIQAGENITLVSSKIGAGDEAYLVAGDRIDVLAANDSDYSLYDKEDKGRWGSKQTRHDEVTDVKAVSSEISAGGDITLLSGGDQKYQAAMLDSGKDVAILSGGSVTFEAAKDLHHEAHSKEDSDLTWTSSKGEGRTDETLRQTQIIAQGSIAIKAVDGLTIDYKHINKQSVSQAIDAMVQADPSLAWIKEAEARGDVDWRAVKEIHDSYSYSNSGLGAGAQLAIAIVMAAVVGPAAMGALTTAGASTAVAAGGAAVAVGASTNATVSFVNNKGNLGDVLKDTTSGDALKGYAISGITAGLTQGAFSDWTGTTTDLNGKIVFSDPSVTLGSFQGLSQFAAKQALQNGTAAALGKILGQDGSLGDALKATLYSTLAAASFNAVGDYTKGVYDEGSIQKILIHAMVGGLLAEASGGDFRTGALAGGANEALVDQLNTWVGGNEDLLTMTSQLVGVLAAATQKDADIDDLATGKWVAENATQYNYKLHEEKAKSAVEAAKNRCQYDAGCPDGASNIDQVKVMDALRAIASKDIQAVSSIDQDVLDFAYYTLRRDPDVRFEILIPDTPFEKTLDWAKLGIDIFSPTPTGKVGGSAKAVEKVSAEVLAELGKKYGDDLSQQIVKGSIGFTEDAAKSALSNLGRVDHSARHLIDAGIITANSGSKAAREAFQNIGQVILTSPSKTFDHVMTQGGQAVKGFYGKIDGNDVVIFVAKEARGKISAGDIVTAIKPSPQQMKNFGL
ncbi:filamentous hemagglutinin [Pseudomonas nitritireducens]|uniref:Filamentous hemagglutinin n=1 Tax=Pseudomonas nitroreducens TaxID=46680 RepID=A0A7W7KTI9_PSENT|nr:filamentous hemagglutinin [Pseudomonas nitritireducens]